MVSWNFGFVFTNLLLKGVGFVFTSLPLKRRWVRFHKTPFLLAIRPSALRTPSRSRDALRPGLATFLSPPRGVAERRETRGTMTRYTRRLRGELYTQRALPSSKLFVM